jgi:TPR repeat protein
MKKLTVIFLCIVILSACGGNVKQDSSASSAAAAQNGTIIAGAQADFNAYLAQAKAGDAAAMSYVGISYLNGIAPAKKDTAQALDWLTKASEKGQGDASLMLATIYDTGKITPQDCDKALNYYLRAVEQGEKAAACILGDKYAGIETLCKQNQDNLVAVVWYKKGLPENDCKNALKNFENINTVKIKGEL